MANHMRPANGPENIENAPRTRESLEGGSVHPVEAGEDDLAGLIAGRAEGLSPSARRASRPGSHFSKVLEQELEPETAASSKARGTAKLHGASTEPASGGDDAKPASTPPKRRVPLVFKVFIGLLVMLVAGAVALWAWVSGIESEMSVREEDRAELEEALVEPENAAEPFYALIIGSDEREAGEVSRSDVIMLVRVDPSAGTISLVSIPRDTMIARDDGSVVKINSMYNYGPGLTVRAVSEFAGVEISHYVEVSFTGLTSVVDALGGVTVDIPENITAGNGGMSFSAGEQVLNGEQALAYARERYNVSGGDFGRAQAQRQIVEAIMRQVLASSPTDMPFLITELARSITTDLSVPDIISYALDFGQSDAGLQVYSAACPSYALNQGGVSYVATMYDEWRAMMQRVDAGLDPEDESSAIPEEQLANGALGAATNAAGPRDYQALAEGALTTDDVAE